MATKKDKKNQMDQANKAALKLQELQRAGGVPMTGLSPTGVPESTIGMSKSDKFFSEGRALDQEQREGYKSFGDKATGEGLNKIRERQGLPPISNTPKEFTENINKSVGFGGKSALLDQEGRDRALKGGVGAGLSYEQADAEVQKAYDFLKSKYGSKDTPTTPTTTTTSTTPTPTPVPTPSPSAPSSPTIPPEVPVEKGPIMQFFDDVLDSNDGPERLLVKGGSMYITEKARAAAAKTAAEAAAEAAAKTAAEAAEAAAKAGGAAGDAAKPFNMIDDAAKTTSEALKQKYNFSKLADDATKPFSMLDDAAKVAGAVGDTSEAARAAKDIAKDIADKAASSTYEGAGAADEAAGAADEAAKAAGKGKGAIARLLKEAGKSKLAKLATTAFRGGGKSLRLFGKAAGPALEIYDAGRYFMGDQEVKDQYAKDVETLGQRVFQPKSVGEFAGALGDVLSPTKNVLGTAETIRQLLKSQRGAREADASLKFAQSVIKAQNDRRKELYSDEEFDKLPKETQLKIRQGIRKEFSDAGVETFGRYQ
jgi:hypothetical protein